MPNFKSIAFKMAVLQGGGQNLPSPCVCYPKDPIWNRLIDSISKLSSGITSLRDVMGCQISTAFNVPGVAHPPFCYGNS